MICVNCGKEISDDSKFCGFCGTPVAAPALAPEPVPAPVMEAAPVPEPAPAPAMEAAPVLDPVPVLEPAPIVGAAPAAEPAPVMEAAPTAEPAAVPAPEQPTPSAGFMSEHTEVLSTPIQTQPVQAQPVQPTGFMPSPAAVPPMPMQGQTAVPPIQAQPTQQAGFAPGQNPAAVPPTPMQAQPMQAQPMQTQPVGAIPPAVPPAAGGKKKKGKAGVIVLIIILVLLLAGGGVLAFMFLNRPIGKINKALEAGDIKTVVELYGNLSNDKDKAEVSEKLLSYAEEARDGYLNEDIGYEEALDTLSLLSGARLETNHEIDAILELVNRIYFSRESYVAAEAYRANGEYAMALENYDDVIADDTLYYDKAQTAMEEVKKELISSAIDEANALMNSGDYVSAEYVLNEALLALPEGSSELESALDAVRAAMEDNIINDVIEDANIAIAEGRYSEAREMLEDALAIYPDNAELQEVLAGLVSDTTLVGTWMLEYDISEIVVDEMGPEFDGFESSLIVPLMFEFGEDGTFKMYVGEGLKDNVMEYIIEYVCEMVGMDRALLETVVVSTYGSWEALFEEIMEEDLDDMLDELLEEMDGLEENAFYEVQGDRIYISDEYGNIDYDDSYETFEIVGDTLFIYFDSDEDILPGLFYPLTLTRVANNY